MDALNEMHWALGKNDVPLCYPLSLTGCEVNKIKNELVTHNIFTATYWPDALQRVKAESMEAALIKETLFLPIDQRMEHAQVEAVGKLVLRLIDKFSS